MFKATSIVLLLFIFLQYPKYVSGCIFFPKKNHNSAVEGTDTKEQEQKIKNRQFIRKVSDEFKFLLWMLSTRADYMEKDDEFKMSKLIEGKIQEINSKVIQNLHKIEGKADILKYKKDLKKIYKILNVSIQKIKCFDTLSLVFKDHPGILKGIEAVNVILYDICQDISAYSSA